MNSGGMFSKWVEPFDTWHLRLLPPILLGLALALVLVPSRPKSAPGVDFHSGSAQSPITPTPRSPSPLGAEPVSPLPQRPTASNSNALATPVAPIAVMRPTRIESPSPNALFWRDRLGDVEGTAEPGSLVRLFLGDRLLGQSTASPDGRFRFRLLDFPAGGHTVRVIATLDRRAQASEPVSFLVKAEAIKSPAAQPTQRKTQPIQPAHPKPSTPLKNSQPSAKKDRPSGRIP